MMVSNGLVCFWKLVSCDSILLDANNDCNVGFYYFNKNLECRFVLVDTDCSLSFYFF